MLLKIGAKRPTVYRFVLCPRTKQARMTKSFNVSYSSLLMEFVGTNLCLYYIRVYAVLVLCNK